MPQLSGSPPSLEEVLRAVTIAWGMPDQLWFSDTRRTRHLLRLREGHALVLLCAHPTMSALELGELVATKASTMYWRLRNGGERYLADPPFAGHVRRAAALLSLSTVPLDPFPGSTALPDPYGLAPARHGAPAGALPPSTPTPAAPLGTASTLQTATPRKDSEP